ncbi:MAG: efflux transporter outer membrane subunit [Aquabacterium sp.]
MSKPSVSLSSVAWACGLLSCALLSGCASRSGPVDAGLTVPALWQSSAGMDGTQAHSTAIADAADPARPLRAWWDALQDPVLAQWIQTAFTQNLNLAQAALKVQRAQLSAGQAASNQWPAVSVQANASAARPLDGSKLTRNHSVTGAASWELDLWGRVAALRDVADWEVQATTLDRRAVALSLSATVANLYWQIAYLNQRVAASEQSIAYAQRTLDLVQAQYRAGDASGLEVAQSTQNLATQRAAHTQWEQQRTQARHALAILVNQPPGAVSGMPEALTLLEGTLPQVEAGLPASLLTQRPDLKAAQLRLNKSAASVQAVRASYYPNLTLTGSLGGASSELSQVLSNPVATLGAGLVLPFVQWRDMDRAVQISKTDLDVAVLAYRQTWYQALADVENALSSRVQFDRQGEHLEMAMAAAKDAERLAEARYRAGAVALKTWLDAQEARRQAENNLALNRLNRLNAWATLQQALGG